MKKTRALWFISFVFLLCLPSLVAANETISFTEFGVQPFESLDAEGYTLVCFHDGIGYFQWREGAIGAVAIRQRYNSIAYQLDDRIFYNYNVSDIILNYLTQQNGGIPPSEDIIRNTTIYRAFLNLTLQHINASTFPNADVGFTVDPNLVLTFSRDARPLNRSTAFSYTGIESSPRPTQGLQNISFEIDPDLFIPGEQNILFFKTDSECDNIIPPPPSGSRDKVNSKSIIISNPILTLDIGPPGLSIKEIQPIQVIQDRWNSVPLIKDKPAMVRVPVKLTSSYGAILDNVTLTDVPLEISFDGTTRRLTRNLYNFNKTTYVLDNTDFAHITSLTNPSSIALTLKIYQFEKGIDAFNFYESPPAPQLFVPQNIGLVNINATLDPDNTLNGRTTIGVRTKQLKQPVKQFSNESTYKIKFYLATTPNYTSFNAFQTTSDFLKLFTDPQMNYLVATYPMPPSVRDNYKINGKSLSIPSGVKPNTWFYNFGFNHKIDRAIIVVPQGGINEMFKVPVGYNAVAVSFAGFRGIFLEETNVAYEETLAHEMGHSYGTIGNYGLYRTFLKHSLCDEYPLPSVAPGNYTAECDTDKNPANGIDWDNVSFPKGYPTDEDGWDVEQKTRKSVNGGSYARISVDKGDAINGYNHYSFMGKASAITNFWITKTNYLALLDKLVAGGRDPKVLAVTGSFDRNGSFTLDPFYVFDGVPDSFLSGDYSFVVLNAAGEVLSQGSFIPQFNYFGGPGQMIELNSTTFALSLDYPLGADHILFKKNTQILQQINITPNTPTVIVNLSLVDPDIFNITWATSDADGDIITVMLDYEANDNPYPLLPPTSSISSFVLDATELPGGLAHVVLTATDGVNTVKINSTSFNVSKKSPVMVITSPETGINVTKSTIIWLDGFGYDPEDGFVNETTLEWFSNITGHLGRGALLNITLPNGIHTITLNGTDNDGDTASDSVVINVLWPSIIRPTKPKTPNIIPLNIILLAPENASLSNKGNVTFIYNVSSNFVITNCSLIIDSVSTQTDTTIQIGIEQSFAQLIEDGIHTWQIECNPIFGKRFYSKIRILTVDAYRITPGPLLRLTFDSNLSMYPAITTDSFGNSHIIWYEDEGLGQRSLFYTKLNNNGTTLIDDKRIFDQDVRNPEFFRVDNDDNNDIYVLVGSAAGLQYIRLNSFGDVVFGPLILPFGGLTSDIAVEKDTGNVHILNRKDNSGTNLFYQKIDKNGNVLVNEMQISPAGGAYPAGIALDSNKSVHIFWSDSQTTRFRYSKVNSSGNIIIDNLALNNDGGIYTSAAIDGNDNAHALSKNDYAKISPNGTILVEKTLPLTVELFSHNPIAVNKNNRLGIIHIATTFPEKMFYSLLDNNGTFLIDERSLLNTPGSEVPLDSSVDQNDSLHLTFSWHNSSQPNAHQEIYYQKIFLKKPSS